MKFLDDNADEECFYLIDGRCPDCGSGNIHREDLLDHGTYIEVEFSCNDCAHYWFDEDFM